MDDIRKLLGVLNRLVEAGNTVIVIEHNLDVIKTADYVIDLGLEGGDAGGHVVGCEEPRGNRRSSALLHGTVPQKGPSGLSRLKREASGTPTGEEKKGPTPLPGAAPFFPWKDLPREKLGDRFCLRVRIDQNQRNHEGVNTQRLDHGQTDQQVTVTLPDDSGLRAIPSTAALKTYSLGDAAKTGRNGQSETRPRSRM